MFPDGLDPIIMSSVKPMFVRGEYDTAVFRAFKEVEVGIRNKDPSLAGESGVDLMNRAFGPTGPLMKGAADKKDRAATRDFVRRSILDLPEPVSRAYVPDHIMLPFARSVQMRVLTYWPPRRTLRPLSSV